MDAVVQAVMDECSAGSDDGSLTFPEVVGKLMAVGVESYHVDFRRAEMTFYMPDGETHLAPKHRIGRAAQAFDAAAVEAAVRTIQRREIGYLEFCERVADAGCVGYFVSLAGRRAVYYGRTHDSYTEAFPQQA